MPSKSFHSTYPTSTHVAGKMNPCREIHGFVARAGITTYIEQLGVRAIDDRQSGNRETQALKKARMRIRSEREWGADGGKREATGHVGMKVSQYKP